MRKKRESYISYDQETFLNTKTGPYTRLDNTAWYLKKKNTNDGKVGYFLNLHTKYQQMLCFVFVRQSCSVHLGWLVRSTPLRPLVVLLFVARFLRSRARFEAYFGSPQRTNERTNEQKNQRRRGARVL